MGDTPPKVERYEVEPFVVAADVYREAPHTGRGGWTWYTGSAGWICRAGIEALLAIRRRGDIPRIEHCIPKGWRGYELTYRYGETAYIQHWRRERIRRQPWR